MILQQLAEEMKKPLSITQVVGWGIIILAIAFFEGMNLGRPDGVPATTVMRTMRFDVMGRFLIVPLIGTWLPWHIVYRPRGFLAMTRWDILVVLAGVLFALVRGKLYGLGGVVG